MLKSFQQFLSKFITTFGRLVENPETRDTTPTDNRDTKPTPPHPILESLTCPYCNSSRFVRRGFRIKKRERVQLYRCLGCRKTFTPQLTKGKRYPMRVIVEALNLYNLGYSLDQTRAIIGQRLGLSVPTSSINDWVEEFADLCRFSRLRPYAIKKFAPNQMISQATLAHQQMFRYRFHPAKCELIIKEDYKHHRFGPLKEYLVMIPAECPHHYFQQGLRASEAPLTFSKKQMIVRAKQNYANRLCQFALQAVKDRKLRHEVIQTFMLMNDSVTVATEVPVYITRDDLSHLTTQLGFKIFRKKSGQRSRPDLEELADLAELPPLITGHIDLLQIRNGQIHILDYKPQAAKARPIEQLTLYAMALSRLTGLRLLEFKCARVFMKSIVTGGGSFDFGRSIALKRNNSILT